MKLIKIFYSYVRCDGGGTEDCVLSQELCNNTQKGLLPWRCIKTLSSPVTEHKRLTVREPEETMQSVYLRAKNHTQSTKKRRKKTFVLKTVHAAGTDVTQWWINSGPRMNAVKNKICSLRSFIMCTPSAQGLDFCCIIHQKFLLSVRKYYIILLLRFYHNFNTNLITLFTVTSWNDTSMYKYFTIFNWSCSSLKMSKICCRNM